MPKKTTKPEKAELVSYTGRIVSVKKDTSLADGGQQEILIATIEVLNGKEVVATRRYSYPLETAKEVIEEDLKRCVAGLEGDANQAILNAKVDAAHKKADETIEALEGKTL